MSYLLELVWAYRALREEHPERTTFTAGELFARLAKEGVRGPLQS